MAWATSFVFYLHLSSRCTEIMSTPVNFSYTETLQFTILLSRLLMYNYMICMFSPTAFIEISKSFTRQSCRLPTSLYSLSPPPTPPLVRDEVSGNDQAYIYIIDV
jgi:hypothetical protein